MVQGWVSNPSARAMVGRRQPGTSRMTLQPQDFAAIEQAGAAVFSRDGGTLLYLRGSGLSQIWALNLTTGSQQQLTEHDEKVAMIRRSPVDDRVVYGIDRGGDERQQLLLLHPFGDSAAQPLTTNLSVIHDFGGWSPDGARIAFASNQRDEAHFDAYVQDLETGERRSVHRGSGMVSVAGFRPDGEALALVRDRAYGDMALLVLDLATGQAKPFRQSTDTNYQSVRWSKDGKSLLALTDYGGADFMRLCRLDPDSNTMTVVAEASDRDIDAWAISSDGSTLTTIENDRGYAILKMGPVDGPLVPVAGLPAGMISDPAFSPDGSALVVTAASPTSPAGLFLIRDGVAESVWQPRSNGAFIGFGLVEWDSFDGRRIPGWLALPTGAQPEEGFPAVIWVHGGPVAQARANFRPDMQMLLAQGYAVLMPNVRGSSGYGRASAESDDLDKRLDCVNDLAYARHFMATLDQIDGNRIGVMGQSYGGYMVNAALTEHPYLWKAAVNYYGISDFITTLEGTGPWRRSHRAAEYGDPQRDAELLERISPMNQIDKIRAPMLLAHGERDPRVPIGESMQLEAALQARQRTVFNLTFDYAGHGFVRPDDKRRIYTAVAEFLARFI
jgi:dipeptidyl aminopeptidase/acylaminoacyl peptidase